MFWGLLNDDKENGYMVSQQSEPMLMDNPPEQPKIGSISEPLSPPASVGEATGIIGSQTATQAPAPDVEQTSIATPSTPEPAFGTGIAAMTDAPPFNVPETPSAPASEPIIAATSDVPQPAPTEETGNNTSPEYKQAMREQMDYLKGLNSDMDGQMFIVLGEGANEVLVSRNFIQDTDLETHSPVQIFAAISERGPESLRIYSEDANDAKQVQKVLSGDPQPYASDNAPIQKVTAPTGSLGQGNEKITINTSMGKITFDLFGIPNTHEEDSIRIGRAFLFPMDDEATEAVIDENYRIASEMKEERKQREAAHVEKAETVRSMTDRMKDKYKPNAS